MTGTHVTLIFVSVFTLLALYVFGTYNELVALQKRCTKNLAQFNEAEAQLEAAQNRESADEQITNLQGRVAFSRQLFNDSVTAYNRYKHKPPTSLVANLFGHRADASLLD